MVGRFTKYNGATEVIDRGAWKPQSSELWRFKPDVYQPFRKPIRSPNLLTNRVEREFGKRIVDQAAKTVARRAPLALAGPLGDLLALGLISYDLYLLLLELQNQRNPVPPLAPPTGGLDNPDNYDWTGWNRATTEANTPPVPSGDFQSFSYADGVPPDTTYTPQGAIYYDGTFGFWIDSKSGYGVGLGAHDYPDIASAIAATPDGWAFQRKMDASITGHNGGWTEGQLWNGWFQRQVGGADPLYIGIGVPLPMDIPLDWAEPDPNMKRNFFPDGIADPGSPEKDPETVPKYKRGPRWRPPRPAPPKKGTRERKMKGPLQTIMNALDIVSEASEFVGAFYDALPDRTKYEWEQKSRGLLDNAGQYGIDGADWKLNALWHNWHKVDIEQAIKNVIANEFQDKVLGQYQRALPKNIGHVADAGSLGLNELIELFNRTIGLS